MGIRAPQSFEWSAVADRLVFSPEGLPCLSLSQPCSGTPDIDNQISAPETPWAISFFRQFHLPMIQAAGIRLDACRILELGAGFGQLAYGTLNVIHPDVYVASDVFTQLVSVLDGNLRKWTNSPVAAAILDPQDPLLFKSGFFNVIHSHSVLHHVLDYRTAVRALYERLASPGVLIFGEPCLEGYLFFLTTVRMFRKLVPLSERTTREFRSFEEFILQRTGPQRADPEFLRQFVAGDKHLYSLYDLMDLAEHVGAKLVVQRDGRSLKNSLKFELKLRGADEDTLMHFDAFLSELLPEGVENAYFSDARQIFSLRKP
jgi:SAM-dependent methyltransferase